MPRAVELLCSRRAPQVAALALMSFAFAGCSADTQTRLSQNSFSNPFSPQQEATGSCPGAPGRAPRTAAICAPAVAVPVFGPAAADCRAAVLSGRQRWRVRGRARDRLLFSAEPSADRDHRQRRAALDRRGPCAGPRAGTTIIVGTSDTLETLSRRYNVSSAAILQANGYKGPRALQPGQQLIIPHQTASAAAPALAAPKAAVAAAPVSAPPSVHVVNRGDTLMSIAHRNRVPVAELAKVNSLDPNSKLKLGQKITVPGAKSAAAPAAAQQVAAAQPGAVAAPATKMAAVTPEAPKEKARLAQATRRPKPPLPTETR